jgi:hypothetical protein
MNVSVRASPPPGSAQAGDLYVDLQSRTLWLGVDPAVDPAAFVLISDIVALQGQIAAGINTSKAYTDTQITTRAPTVHTHTAAQISDFSGAVTNVVLNIPGFDWVKGMVVMYSGSLVDIGVGNLAGWHLCDGTSGTPDLRDKFILGAGSRVIGSGNTMTAFNTGAGGAHDHAINYTAITAAQMPNHSHGGITGYMSHDHAHYTSGGTDGQGQHNHGIATDGYPVASTGGWSLRSVGSSTSFVCSAAGNHGHNFAAWSGGVNQNHYHAVNAEGGNQGHNHTTVGGYGVHADHSVTSAQLREAIPFYALAFIMKL